MNRNQDSCQNTPPQSWGCQGLLGSHVHHVMIMQPCATHATLWPWDLGVVMIHSKAKSYLLTFPLPPLGSLHLPLLGNHKLCWPVPITHDQVPMDLSQSHLKSWLEP